MAKTTNFGNPLQVAALFTTVLGTFAYYCNAVAG